MGAKGSKNKKGGSAIPQATEDNKEAATMEVPQSAFVIGDDDDVSPTPDLNNNAEQPQSFEPQGRPGDNKPVKATAKEPVFVAEVNKSKI